MDKFNSKFGTTQRSATDVAITRLQAEIADMEKREAIFREDWLLDALIVGDFLGLKLGPITEGVTEKGDHWYSRWVEYTFGEDTDMFRVISSGSRVQDSTELNKLSKRRLYYVLLKKYLGENPRSKEGGGS